MKRCAVLLVFLLSSTLWLVAGDPVRTGTVSGIVTDAGSGEQLTGVRVEVVETGAIAFTDRFGSFIFAEPFSGPVTLSFSLVSFEKCSVPVAPSGLSAPLSVSLSER